MEFRRVNQETIGKSPNREQYDVFEGTGKRMELAFFENSNTFELYVENIDGGDRKSGEMTDLFTHVVAQIQKKANELQKPMVLRLDPVKEIVHKWIEGKASNIVGGWDDVKKQAHFPIYYKTFYPDNKKPSI